MDCKSYKIWNSATLDSELDAASKLIHHNHLEACPPCNDHARTVAAQRDALATWAAPEPQREPSVTIFRITEQRPAFLRLRDWLEAIGWRPISVAAASIALGALLMNALPTQPSSWGRTTAHAVAQPRPATESVFGDNYDPLDQRAIEGRLYSLVTAVRDGR